jgi:hypothetical protein
MTSTNPDAGTMSAGDLRDAITTAMDDSGAYGHNLHPTKDVLIHIGGSYFALKYAAVNFVHGSFVLTLRADHQPLF